METLSREPTIVEQAYRAILDAICEGQLEPGERVTQESLAAKLDVSRQPIGQAMLLLKQQKFLMDAGRRGLMVAPLDHEFMRWIYELRLGIEPMAASLAAERATPESIRAFEAIIATGRTAAQGNAIPELIRADMRFHTYLYEQSGNGLFLDVMNELWNHLRRAMREVLAHREYRKAIWVEHEQIVRAIAERNSPAAASLVRAHLMHAAVSVQVALPVAAAPES